MSVATQVCRMCSERDDLEPWLAECDPWDELSASLNMEGPSEPFVLAGFPIEPRCFRCKLLVVEDIYIVVLKNGSVSVPEFGHLCGSCSLGFQQTLDGKQDKGDH